MNPAGGGPPTVALDAYEDTARAAFAQSGYGGEIVEVTELSPMVSTNHVYRLSLAGGHHLVAKVSSYGSYWLFKEDHDRLHRCRQQLQDTRYANLLADTVTKDGRVFVHRDGDLWAALYDEVPTRRSLPRIVSGEDVQNLAEEMARFHQACREVARMVPPTSTSIKSDAIHLLDLLSDPATAGRFPYDRDERATIQAHAERFLEQLDVLGYDDWVKIPVLIDWNLGNFSVDYHGDRFRLLQPLGLRLVPHGPADAGLLLPVPGLEPHGRSHGVHLRAPHVRRAALPDVPRRLPPRLPAAPERGAASCARCTASSSSTT